MLVHRLGKHLSRSSMTTSNKRLVELSILKKTPEERSGKKNCCTFWQTCLSSFALVHYFKKASGLGHYPLQWPLLLNNMDGGSWQHLAGSLTTFLMLHYGEKNALIGYLHLLSRVSWLFETRTLYHEALSGDTYQGHTHLMSQWTLSWEWTNSSLFCWLPLFDLCWWPLFGDSLLSFNIANCRLLFALLFHQSLNWKVGSAWPLSGLKGNAKAGQSLGK